MPKAIPLVAAGAGLLATGGLGAALLPWGSLGGLTTGLAGLGLGFTLPGAASFIGTAAGFVVATAVNAIGSRALAGGAKQDPFSPQATQGRSQMVRSSVDSHKIVYGRSKVSGPIVFVQAANSGPDALGATQTGTNKFLHIVIALAGHEVEEIGDIYFNDKVVPVDGGGWATDSPYSRTVENSTRVQTPIVSASRVYSDILTSGPRPVTFTFTIAGPHAFAAGQDVTIQGMSDASFNGSYVVSSVPSPTTFVVTYSAVNYLPPATATGGSAFRDLTTSDMTSLVRIKKHLGASDQAADADLIAECGLESTFRLRGIAYIYARLEFNQDAFPQGIPNISAAVKGKKVYDPRTTLTAWSDNAALCTRDYLTSDYGFDCGIDEINDSYFTAAANVCDEDVTLSTGGTQDRYTCNGVVDTAAAPLDNLNALVAAMAGAVTYVQGRFRAHAGAYDSPAGAITPSMLAGPVKVRTRPARQDLFNAVQGTYVDPNKNWQVTDFPPITNGTYESEDGGQRISKDILLPFTNHPEAAQRIAKVILEQGRQGIQVELPLNHGALPYAVFDTVTYTDATLGWDAKVFRIKKLSTAGIGPIVLSLQEESSASYDWNSGEATAVDAAPDTNLPDPFTVIPPGALTITEGLYVTRDGAGVKAQANLSWIASPDAFLKAYQPDYKLRSSDVWTKLAQTTDTSATILDIVPGEYDFRVKAINSLGVTSQDAATASAQIAGLSTPPLEPQNLTISTIGGLAILRWDHPLDLDVLHGGKVVIRHSPDETAGWTQSTSIGNALPGFSTVAVLPLKPGVYLAKTVDSSGNESVAAASAVTSQATSLAFANVTSLTEDPAFSGAKTGCVVDGSSNLTLSVGAEFDTIPDLDAVPNLDFFGGVASSGTYLFSGGIDLGSVMNVRITSHVLAQVVNQLDMIDTRTNPIDDWALFDGEEAASADAVLYVRSTPDNPSGSPTWKAWNRLDSGEFHDRAFEFKLELTSQDPAYNILISQLSATIDEVA